MFKLNFNQRSSQILLQGILISLVPSLLYSAENVSGFSDESKNTVQIESLTEDLTSVTNSSSSIEHMFSKLVFYTDKEDPIEFSSHECVRIAHQLVKDMKEDKPTMVPSYASYNKQVEDRFQEFTNYLVSKAATFYEVDEDGLSLLIEMFYKIGPNCIFYNSDVMELWTNIMSSIRLKKDSTVSFVEPEYDKHILPTQIVPLYSASGWLGLARYIKNTNEPISGWWIPVGSRLILLRNLPKQDQHFYVSDHGSQEEVLYSTKKNFLTFSDQGRKELFHSLSFLKLFYEKLLKEDKVLLKKRFLLLLHQGLGSNGQEEFLLYALSLPKNLFQRALLDGRLDYPCSNVGRYIGTRDEKNEPWVLPLSKKEIEIFANIPANIQEEYTHIFNITLEHINHRGRQSQIYIESLYGGTHQGGGLSPFFTQINNIFSPADTERYQMFFILKEISKGLASGLQEFLFRPLRCFGSREEGESYRGFANVFDQYAKSKTARPAYELAQEMRALLKGNALKDEALYFLPNLVAAWFISEAGRNEVSILSSLMLLDLIESGVSLMDEEGCNRYDWKYTLIHPKKPQYSSTKVCIKDLYGKDIDLGNFDGMHPMAHGGSIAASKRLLTNGHNLSPVQQKEGHLIIHWLSEKLKRNPIPNITVVPHPIRITGVLPKEPDYKEIDRLLQAIDKPSSRMDPLLKRKWGYLQIIKYSLKERLSTLDSLLSMEDDIKQVSLNLSMNERKISIRELSDWELQDVIKQESLKLAMDKGKVGPREIPGWVLHDVADLGNCFYDAITHQMGIIGHNFLKEIPEETLPRDSLRLRIQGETFKDEEWAEDEQIDEFVKKFDVILAIIDTRTPENGYVYHFVDNDGQIITKHPHDDEIPLPNKQIIRLAATGNHFLSVGSEA